MSKTQDNQTIAELKQRVEDLERQLEHERFVLNYCSGHSEGVSDVLQEAKRVYQQNQKYFEKEKT